MSTIKDFLAERGLPAPDLRTKYMYSEYLGGPWKPFIPVEANVEILIQHRRFWGARDRNPYGRGPAQYTIVVTTEGFILAYDILLPDGRVWDSCARSFLDTPRFPAWDYTSDYWVSVQRSS